MSKQFVISSHVINTINSLPEEERLAVTSALTAELILGCDAHGQLTPIQEMLYTMIRQYVIRDSAKLEASQSPINAMDSGHTFLNVAV